MTDGSYGIWPSGQAWQVLSGMATWLFGQSMHAVPDAIWCGPQATQAFPSGLGICRAGQETQVFPSAPPTIWPDAQSMQAFALTFGVAHTSAPQACAPVETWCGPQATQAAVASPTSPTRIVWAGQPVKVHGEVGSEPAGGAPMKPGMVGLCVQTCTISCVDIRGWTARPLESTQAPPDEALPVKVQESPSCWANIRQTSHQL